MAIGQPARARRALMYHKLCVQKPLGCIACQQSHRVLAGLLGSWAGSLGRSTRHPSISTQAIRVFRRDSSCVSFSYLLTGSGRALVVQSSSAVRPMAVAGRPVVVITGCSEGT